MLSPVFRVLMLFILVCTQVVALGQKQNIRIIVKDSTDKKALKGASVAIMAKKDSSFLEFGIADTTGKFLFKNINRLQAGFVSVSAAGYEDKKLSLQAIAQGKTRLADTALEIFLSPQFVALQDVVITGTPPIKMNKDTTEFNADYFKTQPNAVLEDLLRKLPGVEVRNGTEIYVNGQRVSKILVDGKEFFSEDPVMILKNLPVEIISKVQVANEKNTTAKETRQPDEIPKVINLKLKKEFRKGAFGKLFGGYGSQDRYEAGGLLNIFRDTLQVSFIGSSNNQNRGNNYFQDDNNAFRNNQSGGGGGITTSHMAGANVSYTLPKGVQVSGQYTLNRSHSLSGSEGFSKQLLGDTAQLSNSSSSQLSNSTAHRVGFRLRWKQDSTGYLSISASANWNSNDGAGSSRNLIYSDAVPLLSQQATARNNSSNRNAVSAYLNYDKTFERLKLDWSVNANYSNNNSKDVTATNSRYVRLTNGLIPDSVIQLRENNTPNRQLSISNGLNKNLGENHTISWDIEYQNQRQLTGGNTFQYLETTGKNELVPSLSVQLTQLRQRLNNDLGYRFNYKKFAVEAGAVWRVLSLRNTYNYDTIPVLQRTFQFLAPKFNISWQGINFSYNRNLQEPPVNAMRPVVDSSNPLYVTAGNPNLRPTKQHHFSLNYYHYFTRAGININLWSSADRQSDAIVTSRQVFADGKTVTGYMNLNGVTVYNAGMGFSKNYHKKDWDYNAGLNNYMYINQQPLILNGVLLNTVSTNIGPSVELGTNYKNKYRLRGNYQVNISKTRSDDASVRTANTVQHTLSGFLSLKFTKHLTYTANANYNISPRLSPNIKRNWLFADMSLLYTFLKKERGQLKLSGYDIFNQNQGIYQSTYLNYITVNQSLVQRQYFMLTFIYTVRKV